MDRIRACLRAASPILLGLGLLLGATARAEPDPIGILANAICASKSVAEINQTLGDIGPIATLTNSDVAEAFGEAAFLADLKRCRNAQAIVDAYVEFRHGKDTQALDAAFAMGHVSDKPTGGTASVGFYEGSFATLGSAGDPPSGH